MVFFNTRKNKIRFLPLQHITYQPATDWEIKLQLHQHNNPAFCDPMVWLAREYASFQERSIISPCLTSIKMIFLGKLRFRIMIFWRMCGLKIGKDFGFKCKIFYCECALKISIDFMGVEQGLSQK